MRLFGPLVYEIDGVQACTLGPESYLAVPQAWNQNSTQWTVLHIETFGACSELQFLSLSEHAVNILAYLQMANSMAELLMNQA